MMYATAYLIGMLSGVALAGSIAIIAASYAKPRRIELDRQEPAIAITTIKTKERTIEL